MMHYKKAAYTDKRPERGNAGNDILACPAPCIADYAGSNIRAKILLGDAAGIQACH